jgi:hypothetical protein
VGPSADVMVVRLRQELVPTGCFPPRMLRQVTAVTQLPFNPGYLNSSLAGRGQSEVPCLFDLLQNDAMKRESQSQTVSVMFLTGGFLWP